MDRNAIDNLIIVRGGGDVATGTILRLYNSGMPVLILDTDCPSAIRRRVAFSEAVYDGSQTVEGVTCHYAGTCEAALELLNRGQLAIMVDPRGESICRLRPIAVIDAILAKRNLGTCRAMAPITIGLGPGFTAGEDVDAVIETRRGHRLGRILYTGQAEPNTGVPGYIGGYSQERVIHSPADGIVRVVHDIADAVNAGEIIAYVDDTPVYASINGILRGIIRDGYQVSRGFKMADIDPRMEERDNCFTVSDKARCIAGGVLEALLRLRMERGI